MGGKRVVLCINGEYTWMQKNEGRKNLMVNVLKLVIGHIRGFWTSVIAEKMQQMEVLFLSPKSHWANLLSSLLVGQMYRLGLDSAYPTICCFRSGGRDPHLWWLASLWSWGLEQWEHVYPTLEIVILQAAFSHIFCAYSLRLVTWHQSSLVLFVQQLYQVVSFS